MSNSLSVLLGKLSFGYISRDLLSHRHSNIHQVQIAEQYVFADNVQLGRNLLNNVLECHTANYGPGARGDWATMNIKLVYLLQKSYVTSRVWLYSYTVIRVTMNEWKEQTNKKDTFALQTLFYFCSQFFVDVVGHRWVGGTIARIWWMA